MPRSQKGPITPQSGPGTLTHVGLGPGHGGRLLCAFHDSRDVEVCDVNMSYRKRNETPVSKSCRRLGSSLCDLKLGSARCDGRNAAYSSILSDTMTSLYLLQHYSQ